MTSPAIVAIHGGAGTILRDAMDTDTERQYRAELTAILQAAQKVLADGGSALDAVTVAVRMLEDCPLFNAGRGAVYTAEGKHELDAAVMDGATLAAGQSLSYEADPARHLYLVPSAKVRINGIEANARDGVAITGEERIMIEADADAELVLVDAR